MTAHINFDPQTFRAALGTFTTGVTIITSRTEDNEAVGVTANSFNSVSLDPPLVLWSLGKNARSLAAFSQNKHWNVHVLSTEQEALSGRFARQGEDKFAGIELDQGVSNAPLLQDCTARFQCRTAFQYDGGDHVIFVGEVLAFDHSDRSPLAFQSGQYALATRKPREELRLSTSPPPPECSYTEDLLGYLLGRAHYQLLHTLRQQINSPQKLDEHAFYLLSVLCIRDGLTLDELNEFVAYTGKTVQPATLVFLERQNLIASEIKNGSVRYLLTADGREISVNEIAQAKALEQNVNERLGSSDAQALKVLLKRLIAATDCGLPDLWGPR